MTSKPKILHIIHAVGGVEVSLRMNLQNIDPTRFEHIILLGQDDTRIPFLDRDGNELREYRLPIYREISPVKDIKSLLLAYKIVKAENPCLIHCHGTKAGFIGRVLGTILRIKALHSPHAFSYLSAENRIKRMLYLFIEKVLSKTNSVLVACSLSEYNRAVNEVGYPTKRAVLLTHAINSYTDLEQLSIPIIWQEEYICTVGRPCYQKNLEELIRVVLEIKKSRNIHLVIMGVGFYSNRLKMVNDLIEKLDLTENITLLNWTSRSNVLNIIKNSKLYVSTSLYEGLPYAIIESLSLSIPCVVSNCDGNRDLIINGENGFIAEPNNTVEFADKCIELLYNNTLHSLMSKNARATFEKDFDIKTQIAKLENLYKMKSEK